MSSFPSELKSRSLKRLYTAICAESVAPEQSGYIPQYDELEYSHCSVPV